MNIISHPCCFSGYRWCFTPSGTQSTQSSTPPRTASNCLRRAYAICTKQVDSGSFAGAAGQERWNDEGADLIVRCLCWYCGDNMFYLYIYTYNEDKWSMNGIWYFMHTYINLLWELIGYNGDMIVWTINGICFMEFGLIPSSVIISARTC